MRRLSLSLFTVILLVLAMVLSEGCGEHHGANLVSIGITPVNPAIAKGTTKQFTATGIYSDNTTQDVTSSVTWSSSDNAIATVDSSGLASGLAIGTTTITATSGSISGTTVLTVTGAALTSIAVTPANPSISLGTKKQFTATGTFTDNTTQDLTSSVTWTTSDASTATIDNAGLATGAGVGTATITAASGDVSGNTLLTVNKAELVSISVTPPNPSSAKGLTRQFKATGTFTDNTTQDLTSHALWSSTNPAKATIDATGLATALDKGQTIITATDPNTSISGTTTFTITDAEILSITIAPPNPSVPKGLTKQFSAKGTYTDSTTPDITASVTWDSSDHAIAQISNAAGSKGLAVTLGTGTTLISAIEPASSIAGTTTLTVTDAVLTALTVTSANGGNGNVNQGYTQQFTATGTFSDGSTNDLTSNVTWTSSDITKATIDASGLATGVAPGPAFIIATSGSITGSTTLIVNQALDACSSISSCTDTDGDGFCDAWEDNDYIDLNGNGVSDEGTDFQFPHEAGTNAKVADKNIPNIYVQYDYMGWASPGMACATTQNCIDAGQPNEVCHEGYCNHNHQPADVTFQNVVDAFANHNVRLYIDPNHNEIPHSQVVTFQSASDPTVASCAGAVPGVLGSYAVNFHDVKNSSVEPRRKDVIRYAVFGHYNTCDSITHCLACPPDRASPPGNAVYGAGGLAELPGNDFMVTLGDMFYGPSAIPEADAPLAEAGLLMHELGHTLGLHHNGDVGLPGYSPNYMSVMNYRYSTSGIWTSLAVGSNTPDGPIRLDYSNDALPVTLTELSLDENAGVSPLASGKKDLSFFFDGTGSFAFGAGAGPIDWNGNGIIDSAPVSVDLNGENGTGDQFRGYADWEHGACVTSNDCPFNNVRSWIGGGPTREPCLNGKCQSFIYNFQCMPWGMADGPAPPEHLPRCASPKELHGILDLLR